MNFGKLFLKHTRTWQLMLVSIGAFAGLFLLWLPVQVYIDITDALAKQKDLISNQYFIVNKGVSLVNTLGFSSGGFTTEEMQKLKAKPFVKDVSAFTPNRFGVGAAAHLREKMDVYTEIFLESVPDRFIDQLPPEWHWSPRSAYVPVILPAEYLDLYNFDFAPGQGLPQISQGAAKLFPFELLVRDGDSTHHYPAHIAAFTERINTILVPQSFVDYNNEQYAIKPYEQPSKLIVEVSDPAAFSRYVDSTGIKTNSDYLRTGKVQSLSKRLLLLILLLTGLVVLLSIGSFILFSNLLVARSEYEIRTLVLLGYRYQSVGMAIFRFFALLVAGATAGALIGGLVARYYILKYLSSIIDAADWLPSYQAIVCMLALAAVYLLINYLSIKKMTRQIAEPF
ncbi:MAG: hypothetical protein U0V74_17350 [Chitinophagales bacterium]